jgi:TatD DNase family protein
LIDSHTHLFLCEGEEDGLVAAAETAGVRRMLNVGLGAETNPVAVAAAERHDGVFATAGCHPTGAGEFDDELAAEIRELARHERVRAIGETGIDYYRDSATPEEQRVAFAAQIEIAGESGLPIVIHARDPEGEKTATDDVFSILDDAGDGLRVILHCFLAPWRVEDAIERGWYCSFSGIVTYPAADDLRGAAAALPDELLLVETDAPYLSPQPMRGKPNEPANVVATAEMVAGVRGQSYEELERVVEANARALFGW